MQTTSTLYKSIFADPTHVVEWKITVNGTDYTGQQVAPAGIPRLIRRLIEGEEPSVGNCVAGTFSCAIYEASGAVPRMAEVRAAIRLALPLPENSQVSPTVSEWIDLGTFYIDTRQVDEVTGALLLSCFDRMLVATGAGGATYAQLTGYDEWPQPQAAVAAEIASIMGISLDPRTVIRSGRGYMVEYPNDLSCLEVLGYIGAANAGNWCVTSANALRLVPLTGGGDSFDLGTAAAGLKTAPALASWAGVIVYYADEAAYEAGDTSGETGRVLTCDCPWATQETADSILAAIIGHAYQPYSAPGAIIDLALELGDIVTAGRPGETVAGAAMYINITGSGLEQADVGAPGEDEIDHEYPYASYVDRSLRRKVTLGQSYYGTRISRDKGIEIKRSDGLSEALFNSDVFAMRALIDGVMKDRLYFDPLRGDFVFDGALGADAILTASLYAENGDVAELTVDRLSTSRRIRKYILQDTSDDNYVKIQDNYIRLITGSVTMANALLTEDGNPILTEDGDYIVLEESNGHAAEQAENRYGEPLYWQREPVGHTTDGYPTDSQGRQIYATTEETEWPVMVYRYVELVKLQEAFIQRDGLYQPEIVIGAGDNNGNSKGYIYKEQTDLLMRYVSSAGKNVDIKLSDDGYVDIHRLRRATEMDFSDWENGNFSEKLEGGLTANYLVDFDQQGRPIKIYDETHECDIVW